MSRRLIVPASLVTSTLLTLLLATPAVAASSSTDYIAMGDSYSAGIGAPGQSGVCGRSAAAYPGLWNAAHDPASYRSVACSGATTDTLRLTQLPYLSSRTDLVTLTIGGNDAGFAPAVITCTVVADSGCTATVDVALAYIHTVMPAKLDNTYADIHRKAPNARVVVLGYPILFDTTTVACGTGGMSQTKRRALNEGAVELNKVIKSRAEAAGFRYGDAAATFAGHGICAPTAWLHSLVLLPPTDSFHPTANGYRYGYLPALTAALD
jgi:lysophospholipase L1-like esterase